MRHDVVMPSTSALVVSHIVKLLSAALTSTSSSMRPIPGYLARPSGLRISSAGPPTTQSEYCDITSTYVASWVVDGVHNIHKEHTRCNITCLTVFIYDNITKYLLA